LYRELYVADAATGAIAQAFGRIAIWNGEMLRRPSGEALSLASYDDGDRVTVCDLDDPAMLLSLGLRPSNVVSRDRTITRDWSRRIYQTRSYSGISWWSSYDPQWRSFGIWSTSSLSLADIRELSLSDADLLEAARVIVRRIE
jgi:hypothetical protein